MEMHRRMGYNYQINQATFPVSSNTSDLFLFRLSLANIGVAPFYFNWDVQVALLNRANDIVAMSTVGYDTRDLQPRQTVELTAELNLSQINPDEYAVALRVVQPGADREKPTLQKDLWRKLDARNTYIEFANDIDVIVGEWNDSTELKGGWSILGSVTVNSAK